MLDVLEIDQSSEEKETEPTKETSVLERPLINQYIKRLPSSEMYYRSYMHKETIQFVASSIQNDFFLSMSIDGVLKFWHRDTEINTEIEFVKQINSKDGSFYSYSISYDGKYIATGFRNGKVCIFDISSFDLINRFDFKVPDGAIVCFFHEKGSPVYMLGIAFSNKPDIILVDIESIVDEKNTIPPLLDTFSRNNSKPITAMNFIEEKNCAVSVDEDGVIEFWDCQGRTPKFDYQSALYTDLYSLAENSLKAISITVSKTGKYFAICCSDWSVRIFDVNSGKIIQTVPDDMPTVLPINTKAQKSESKNENSNDETEKELYGLDQDDYDSRVLIERQYRASNPYFCVEFDDTGSIILFPSMFGLKYISVETGELLRIIGKVEKHERFNSVSLLQNQTNNEIPMAILTAFEKQRFYLFTTKPPESSKRDVVNEKSLEKQSKSIRVKKVAPAKLPTVATLHTSFGSIKFEMYPDECPLTVENFVTHSRRGYYDNIRIHRVVRDFCIQAGDPTGTGTGGESIWGKNFDDEILPDGHTFDEPGMVGMANNGVNSNASQFFITTQKASHLNGKHTCWGKVLEGMENIRRMELEKVDIHNHPLNEIKLYSITFS
ncbi:Peptidylprolyl isomerase domain and WD repeat containing protein 1 [Tritrichomonas musculus]|uniref:peptidylprolyl isomerase n=1 Tax=Tritrichomonas musculus TaxID=1915356 RepID=A0ABR2KHD9_9EUKA